MINVAIDLRSGRDMMQMLLILVPLQGVQEFAEDNSAQHLFCSKVKDFM